MQTLKPFATDSLHIPSDTITLCYHTVRRVNPT
jgi:hypothetical protein